MNVAYNRTIKQFQNLQRDLAQFESGRHLDDVQQDRLEDAFKKLNKLIDDYDHTTKRELNLERQRLGLSRLQKFRDDYTSLRQQFEKLKHKIYTRDLYQQERQTLLEQEADGVTTIQMIDLNQREAEFADYTEQQLDSFIAQGRSALSSLVEQRHILKGTQKRLLNAANTLGLSRSVIQYIERRTTQDKLIFFAGVLLCILCMWAIIHYFG